MRRLHRLGYFAQPGVGGPGRLAERGDRHYSGQGQPLFRRDCLGNPADLGRLRSPAASAGVPSIRSGWRCAAPRVVQPDLDQAADEAACLPRAPAKRLDQPDPVHRVHHVGVPDDARGLIHLQLPDEMPPNRDSGRRARGGLRRRFLILVLADVDDSQAGQQDHI